MSKIEQAKTYSGADLESIFFRPMLQGDNATALGIRVLYNTPQPAKLHFWQRSGDILRKLDANGWSAGAKAERFQKTIAMNQVKAEQAFAASDYFNLVWEKIAGSSEVNFGDLSGTQLEEAETALFKQALAESIRMTMWYGNTARTSGDWATFDGILKRLTNDMTLGEEFCKTLYQHDLSDFAQAGDIEKLLRKVWDDASDQLRYSKGEGNLVYLVSSDIYTRYEDYLNSSTNEIAYLARQTGREGIAFNGIPLVDIRVGSTLPDDLPQSFVLLTDRRNLAMAVNTADFPGSEVRMWYNPDAMENRQRAVFMAGCDYLLPEMISLAIAGVKPSVSTISASGGPITLTIEATPMPIESIKANYLTAADAVTGNEIPFTTTNGKVYTGSTNANAATKVRLMITYVGGIKQQVIVTN